MNFVRNTSITTISFENKIFQLPLDWSYQLARNKFTERNKWLDRLNMREKESDANRKTKKIHGLIDRQIDSSVYIQVESVSNFHSWIREMESSESILQSSVLMWSLFGR